MGSARGLCLKALTDRQFDRLSDSTQHIHQRVDGELAWTRDHQNHGRFGLLQVMLGAAGPMCQLRRRARPGVRR